MMSVNGEADGEGMRHAIAIVDTMTGIHSVAAINAALYARTSTGKGQHIDLALYDTALACLGNMGSYYLIGGDQPRRAGNGHFASAPNGSFETANGKIYMAVANQKLFVDTCKAMGHPEWATDPRFSTIAARVANKPLLTSMMEEVLKTDTKENWAQKFRHLPAGPIRTMKEALDEPEVKRRGMLKTYKHTRVGDVPLIGSNYHFSDTPVDDTRPPPSLGEHTESVLKDLAGLSADEIKALREKKVGSASDGARHGRATRVSASLTGRATGVARAQRKSVTARLAGHRFAQASDAAADLDQDRRTRPGLAACCSPSASRRGACWRSSDQSARAGGAAARTAAIEMRLRASSRPMCSSCPSRTEGRSSPGR